MSETLSYFIMGFGAGMSFTGFMGLIINLMRRS